MKKIALFGGSFDPIHLGHVSIIEALVHSKRYEHIFVIPCGSHAFQKKFLLTPEKRLKLLNLSLSAFPNVEVSDLEITNPNVSYSIETVLHFKKKFPEAELVFVLGTDAFEKLDQWHRISELVKLCHFLVIKRAGQSLQNPVLSNLSFEIMDINAPAISSTEVRERIVKELSLKGYVPEMIAKSALIRPI